MSDLQSILLNKKEHDRQLLASLLEKNGSSADFIAKTLASYESAPNSRRHAVYRLGIDEVIDFTFECRVNLHKVSDLLDITTVKNAPVEGKLDIDSVHDLVFRVSSDLERIEYSLIHLVSEHDA